MSERDANARAFRWRAETDDLSRVSRSMLPLRALSESGAAWTNLHFRCSLRSPNDRLAERQATVVRMKPARRRRLMRVATKTLHRLPSTRPVHHRLAETLVEVLIADADGRIDRDHSQHTRGEVAVILFREQPREALA